MFTLSVAVFLGSGKVKIKNASNLIRIYDIKKGSVGETILSITGYSALCSVLFSDVCKQNLHCCQVSAMPDYKEAIIFYFQYLNRTESGSICFVQLAMNCERISCAVEEYLPPNRQDFHRLRLK